MIRQARAYLVGAVSGTMLIGLAIGAFVLVVSLQVFRDWPVAGLGGGGDGTAAEGEPASGGDSSSTAAGETAVAGGGDGSGSASGLADGAGGTAPGASGGDGASGAAAPDAGSGGGGQGGATSSGGGGGQGGGGSQAGGGSGGSGSTSEQVTDTVNEVVSGVDETALGGTLEKTGVTGTTEKALDGVAGPDSTVGKVVDKTADTVGGVLGE